MNSKEKNIYLIEDDDVDIMVFRRALRQVDIPHTLTTFTNGEEYLEFLETHTDYPDILFLDLNTPRMSGIELLKHLTKKREKINYPIIVLSTSEDENDIKDAYKYKADGYMLKSISFVNFVENLKIVLNYWNVVHIPKGVSNDPD